MNTSGLTNDLPAASNRLEARVRMALAAIGVAATGWILMDGTSGLLGDAVAGRGGPVHYEGVLGIQPASAADTGGQRALAAYLAKRYRIAQAATEELVGMAYDAGRQVGLDPLLILAVMAIESRFNPIAESDQGAQGLMQVIPKMHQDKIDAYGGPVSFLDPTTNVIIGARILKEYIHRTGSLESGLQFYNGALADTDSQYSQKVIAEQERLKAALQRGERLARAASI